MIKKWYNAELFVPRLITYSVIVIVFLYIRVFPIDIPSTHHCFLCGMTRAVNKLLYLDFAGAYNCNKNILIIIILIVFIILDLIGFLWKKKSK